MITLNKGQQNVFEGLKMWHKKMNEQLYQYTGAAGTGKTTIIHFFIDYLGIDIENVLFVTFVGKAALVMRRHGLNAQTIHSAIYHLEEEYEVDEHGAPIMKNGKFLKKLRFIKRPKLQDNIELIVVDEGYMVPKNLALDLLSFGLPTIVTGDRCQLPPVFGAAYFLQNPDAELNEIMRQAEGDPIINLSWMAKNGEDIPLGKYGRKCFVIDRDSLNKYKELFVTSKLVICGRNKTRNEINDFVRYEINGAKSEFPEIGDKLVCRKNNWELELDGIPMINGLFGTVTNIDRASYDGKNLDIDFKPSFFKKKEFRNMTIDYKYLVASHEEKKQLIRNRFSGDKLEYGYASTCHLAQGSQAKSVLVIEEKIGDYEFHKKWLYTAITRAEKRLVIVKEPKKKKIFFF